MHGTPVRFLVWEDHTSVSLVAQLCPTLCDPMNHSTSGLPVHHQLPEFIQTHVHLVGEAIQPSHPLSSPFPPAPNLSQHQGLFQWVNSSHEVAKILEFQLQHYSFQRIPRAGELPDVQAGFRKGRGTRDQIANFRWIMEKAREFQKNIYFCFIDYAKAFDYVDHNKLENSERDGNTRPPDLPLEKSVCRSGSNS